jgi:hypothetical protein
VSALPAGDDAATHYLADNDVGLPDVPIDRRAPHPVSRLLTLGTEGCGGGPMAEHRRKADNRRVFSTEFTKEGMEMVGCRGYPRQE